MWTRTRSSLDVVGDGSRMTGERGSERVVVARIADYNVISLCLYPHQRSCVGRGHRPSAARTCRSRKEHTLPFLRDVLKHATLLLAELGDGRRLVGATGGTERDARREEGIDLGLFGLVTGRFVVVFGVVSVAKFALLGVAGGW